MKPEQVRVQYHEGSGTFGRSCYGDAEQTAAILSQAVGRPVRVQFMRWDEHGWDQYGPAHLAEVRAGIDARGNLVAYEYHGWQHGWTVTSTVYDISLQKPGVERASGSASITVNPMSTGSMYKVPNRKVVSHAVPMVGYLRGAALRSPLDLSFSFASEQTIDELAHAIKMDPLEFRRKNIGDKRWRGVLDAAAAAANWTPRVAASLFFDSEVVTGRGIGLGTHHVSYGAAVADVEVNKRTGNIVVKKVFAAMDVGLAVNPGLVENQIIGQAVQSVSRVLKEEVTFNKTGVTSLDWNSYPVLRFAEHPEVVPVVVQRMNEPSTGAGEEVMGATAAAVANAVFDATGARLRQYPMTPARVRTALANMRS
jgi:CO/xanthine dehydrogenase Mo-binding subunit